MKKIKLISEEPIIVRRFTYDIVGIAYQCLCDGREIMVFANMRDRSDPYDWLLCRAEPFSNADEKSVRKYLIDTLHIKEILQ